MITHPNNMLVTITIGEMNELMAQAVRSEVGPLMTRIDELERSQVMSNDDMCFGLDAIAARLGVSTRTVSDAISDGKLNGIVKRFGPKYRAKKSDLDNVSI